MHRTETASAVADDLFSTEAAIEEALVHTVELLRSMMEARRQLGLPFGISEPALRRVVASVEALGVAQHEMAEAHEALNALRERLGLPGLAFGPLIKPHGRAAITLAAV